VKVPGTELAKYDLAGAKRHRKRVALHLSDNLAPESARLMLSGQVTVGFEVAVQFSRL
jgi:hypothetical protein